MVRWPEREVKGHPQVQNEDDGSCLWTQSLVLGWGRVEEKDALGAQAFQAAAGKEAGASGMR